MRKLLIIVLLSVSRLVLAQQEAQYSNYQMNNFMLNPAVAGSYSYLNAKVGMRYQWLGIEGAPRTLFATFHAPIHHPDATPKIRHHYPHHGVGLSISSDGAGAFKNQSFLGTYAYHLKLDQHYTLSAGASFGFKSFAVNEGSLEFVQTSTDQTTGSGISSKLVPDANMGLWLYSDRLFAGISGRQLLGSDLSLNSVTQTAGSQKQERHYFATLGYKVDINTEWHFIPSVMVQMVTAAPTQFDLNGTFWYEKKFAIGASYRHLDAVYMILDYVFNDALEIGYAYDITLSKLSKYNSGTHEIIIGYQWGKLGNKYACPGQFW